MPTAFDPFSGVNARVKAVAITPVLTTDVVTVSGTTTAWLEHTGWNLEKTADGPKIYTANSSADAEGSIAPQLLRGSLLSNKLNLEGVYNGGTTTTDARFKEGSFVKIDVIFHATYALGYYGMLAKVVSFKPGAKIGPEAIQVSIGLEISGLVPAPSTS